jgi:hypothetical protein
MIYSDKINQIQSFRAPDCDLDHCLVVENAGRLKLNELEGKELCCVEVRKGGHRLRKFRCGGG